LTSSQGLIHRDIKPANILLENGAERVKITDFGLACAAADSSLTQVGMVAGTPDYMAPEQARGERVDHRADLFSLGSVLYAMSTGGPPFRASTALGTLRRVSDESPRPIQELNLELPDWFVAIVDKLQAKSAEDRFQSAGEVAELLAQCLAHVQQPTAVLYRRAHGGRLFPHSWRLGVRDRARTGLCAVLRHDLVRDFASRFGRG
jgi:serine/threonine protein kinase